ncbi:MAG TPA: ATP-binding cassette domain-containing protein [Firmicutes bacterium]|nr:ATP-binding cassette domain-containing protein [Bacillota bacterium]
MGSMDGILIIDREEQLQDNHTFDKNIREIYFKIPVVAIRDRAYFNCENLTKVVFEKNVGKIGKEAFAVCMIEELIFKERIMEIGDRAFESNPLNLVTFHNDVQIGRNVFNDCGNFNGMMKFELDGEIEDFPTVITYARNHSIAIVERQVHVSKKQNNTGREVWIRVQNTNISVPVGRGKKKRILTNVNLEINPGEMIMVIGGSGTGKTTLLKNILGFERPLENRKNKIEIGKKVGDRIVYEPLTKSSVQKKYRKLFFYAPQFSISNEYLTVEQEIQKNAMLFRGRNLTEPELKSLAETFRLWDDDRKLLNTLVKRISGGQKKKLLMACSNIGNPSLYVFDEPDSGLDEPSAFHLFIRDLYENQVIRQGKTVMIVSHHPHNYMALFNDNRRIRFEDIFNKLIVLAQIDERQGSSIAYCGTPTHAREFFDLKTNDPYSRIVYRVQSAGEGEGLGAYYVNEWNRRKQ